MNQDEKYTAEEYAAIEASIIERVESISDKPWIVKPVTIYKVESYRIYNLSGEWIADVKKQENATLIAYAPTDIKRLLAEIERLRDEKTLYGRAIVTKQLEIAKLEAINKEMKGQ